MDDLKNIRKYIKDHCGVTSEEFGKSSEEIFNLRMVASLAWLAALSTGFITRKEVLLSHAGGGEGRDEETAQSDFDR